MLPLVILPLLLLGGFSYISSQNHVEQQTKSLINSHLKQHQLQILSYYQTVRTIQTLLSRSTYISLLLNEQQKDNQLAKADVEDLFAQYAATYQDFYEIRLLTLQGIEQVRYTTKTDLSNISEDESDTDYFVQLKNMTEEQLVLLIINPDNEETALISATKIYSQKLTDNGSKVLAGYLVFTVRPSAIIDAVNSSFGVSGASFVTNGRGLMLFAAQSYMQGTVMPPTLFNQLKATVDTQDLVTLPQNGIGMHYQGRELPNGYLLFTGVGVDEMTADRKYLELISIIATIVVVIMVPFLLFFFFKTLVLQPIAELTMAKQAVGKGNLDVRLDVQQSDEIGELYSSFNVMVRQLRVYRERETESKMLLEEKITGRTKALKDANRELEGSNKA